MPTAGVVATIVDERTGARAEVPLVRYHDWAERGPSQMRVWVPVVGRSLRRRVTGESWRRARTGG